MKQLIKYLGVIVLLVGVVFLAIIGTQGIKDNGLLLVGLGIIVLGYIGHIVINKRLED